MYRNRFVALLISMLGTLSLAACANEASHDQAKDFSSNEIRLALADLKDLGEAPELVNDVWINSDVPLRIANLRGKVILLEFWTFG